MHWGSSFFVLFFLVSLTICLLPVRLHFSAQHRQQWRGAMTIECSGLHYTKQFGTQAATIGKQKKKESAHIRPIVMGEDAETDLSAAQMKTVQPKQRRQWRFQAHWRNIIKFFRRAGHAALRRLSLEQLTLRCNIGFQQPDRTAYSYALFWAVLSVLPPQWMEQADITYVPDFQRQRQDIELQGIIRTTVGQVIVIIVSWLWLAVQARLEQHRKEQIVYES